MANDKYYITDKARERFRKYLFDERISFSEFARRCGVCRQYLDRVYKGKVPVTARVREHFKKGGYDLL